jgi:cystine transport system substrate-binding protein
VRIAALNQKADSLRAERASLVHQLGIAKAGSRIAQTQLARRLRMLYEQGNVEPLEIVFGAKSLDEALTNLDSLSRASGQGEDVLRQLKAARTRIAAEQKALGDRRAALARATAHAQATAAALARTRSARDGYIASLASERRLNQTQIDTLVAQAEAARVRSQELARATAGSAVATGVFTPAAAAAIQSSPATPTSAGGGRTVTVAATGYSLAGSTATGLPVGWGIVAVDPSVIPLGSHIWVPGYGEAVAADTGGSVMGATIDLWFPTVAQANAWGRRTVTIVIR